MNLGKIDPADYSAIADAFYQVGAPIWAQVTRIANDNRRTRATGKRLDVRTVKRAWDIGWPSMLDGEGRMIAPPLKEGLSIRFNQIDVDKLTRDAEKVKALASEGGAASVSERYPEIAKSDASRQETGLVAPSPALISAPASPAAPSAPEADAIAAGLNNATGFEVLIGKALHISMKRLEGILDRLLKDCEHHDLVPTGKLFDMLETLGKLRSQNANAAKIWVELRNLSAGQPTSINEQRHTHALSPEDREERQRQIAGMAALLRTSTDGIKGYKGEQTDTKTGVIIDVPSTPVVAEPVATV